MTVAFFQIISSLLLILIVPLGLFIALIFLQKYICKNLNIKFGLILPIVHLIPLVLITINFVLFGILYFIDKNNVSNATSVISTYDINTFIGIIHQITMTILLLLIFIVPALVYYLIYRHYKKKRKQLENQEINNQQIKK